MAVLIIILVLVCLDDLFLKKFFHIEFGKRLTRQTKLPDQLINYIGESWKSYISCERAKYIFVQIILHLQKYDDEVSNMKIGIRLFHTIAVNLGYNIHVAMSY